MNSTRRSFLKSLGWGASVIFVGKTANARKSEKRTMIGRLQNWARNTVFKPKNYFRPTTLRELKEIVETATKFRVVGSKHSFNDIFETNDTIISLKNLVIQSQIDAENQVATLPANMKLSVANRLLDKHGLAFPSLGEIEEQTLAGLVATATHGTSLNYGTISDSLVAVTVLTPEGQVLEVNEQNSPHNWLEAFKVNLGALGIILTVTFRLEREFRLEEKVRVSKVEEAISRNLLEQNDYLQIYYIPFTDSAILATRNRTTKPSTVNWLRNLKKSFMENLVLDIILSMKSHSPHEIPKFMLKMLSLVSEEQSVGKSYEIMTTDRTMKYHEIEIAIDLEYVAQALERVRDNIVSLSEKVNYFAHMPVTIRFVKGDSKTFLSPTMGRPTAYFSFTSHTSFVGYEDYFASMEKILTEEFGGRPHWGKHYFKNPRDAYGDLFERFLGVREQLDPKDKLVNNYIERLIRG